MSGDARRGRRWPLRRPRTQVGGSADPADGNDLVFDVAKVSGRHAVFEVFPSGDVWITDLGARNGTFVNDRQLASGERRRVRPGDEVMLSRQLVLQLVLADAAPDAPVAPPLVPAVAPPAPIAAAPPLVPLVPAPSMPPMPPIVQIVNTAGPAPAAAPATETTFYSDAAGVRITNTRAIFGRRTFAMANISSVALTSTPPDKEGAHSLIAVGAILALGGFALASLVALGYGIAAIIVGIALLAVGAAWAERLGPTFHVQISSSSGENHVLSSPKKPYIEAVVQAMNEAIIRRG